MCKNPGDSNYFQVLREEGDGEEKRSAEKKGVARDGEKKRKREGYISSSSGSVKVCWLAIAVGQLILTPDHTPQPALKRQQPEKDTRKGGQDEYRMGTNHSMVRLSLNTVYNLFCESFSFSSIYVTVGCSLRLIKQVTLWRGTDINCIISPVSQVNKFSVYENVKKLPRVVRAHICAKTQVRCGASEEFSPWRPIYR